jgi:predicted nucleic acid-binding protein
LSFFRIFFSAALHHIQPGLSIAATAQHYDLTTVSRDTSDFEKARVTVFNPWVEAAPPET